jgi:SAM-dependent methyltransferase
MMCKRFTFDKTKRVIEIASNDGYLLQYFKEKGIPVLGIEPTKNTAKVAKEKGIPTIIKYFGRDTAKELAKKGKKADLLIGNNVLAHVPDLNDFVGGMKMILKSDGIITMEFPHLLKLMQKSQFDTIYHEHYSYFSLMTVRKVFAKHGLTVFDVKEIPTHGGSLRIFARHSENNALPINKNVRRLIRKETVYGLNRQETYKIFSAKVRRIKQSFLEFLIDAKRKGKTIVGYGAPAKGNTFLNYCGVRTDFIEYTVDASPHKQNHFLPGVRIPVYAPKKITQTRPDYIVILPWNIKKEVMEQMREVRRWGGKFVTAIPKITIS